MAQQDRSSQNQDGAAEVQDGGACVDGGGAKRLPLWVCEAMPLGGSCLRSRLKRSPYVGFAPLSWQRRGARRVGRTSSVLPLRGNPPSPSGEGLGMPFALLLLGLCSKLTGLPFGEGTRVKQNRPWRLHYISAPNFTLEIYTYGVSIVSVGC